MKKTLLMIALLVAGVAFAGDPETEQVKSKVRKEISYPAFLKEKQREGEVRVSFMIRENGKVNVIEINTGSEMLREHVVSQMAMMQFDTASFESGKVINLTIHFKLY